jgi:hypothetical protein
LELRSTEQAQTGQEADCVLRLSNDSNEGMLEVGFTHFDQCLQLPTPEELGHRANSISRHRMT